MIDTDKYKGHTPAPWKQVEPKDGNPRITTQFCGDEIIVNTGETSWEADMNLIADAPLLLEEVKRLREDYENMSEVLRERGMDICRHCRVIYHDDDMNHPHYPTLHPWHMDGMCMGSD